MTFEDLNLNKPLLSALDDLGITTPTAIQEKAFGPIMAGRDVVGIAQTGTGKTFAYLLPSLRLWQFTKSPYPQILIIVPTRELVLQVVGEVRKLSAYLNLEVVGVYGGTNLKVHKAEVEVGLDVIVGTPGRLVDLLKDGILKLKQVKRLILDEVDEMLDLGFRAQLNDILEFLPRKRQHLFFSATMIDEVLETIQQFTDHFEVVEAAPSGAPLENIDQYGYALPNFNSKANLLEHLLQTEAGFRKVLVFVSTKKLADILYERLEPTFGEALGVIHSSKSQNFRFNTVAAFEAGTYRCLIATDLVARGLDVSAVTHVVNFDVSDTAEKHIHRVGRTGRAEEQGVAITFHAPEDAEALAAIEALMGRSIPTLPHPAPRLLSDELIALEQEPEYVAENTVFIRPAPENAAFHEKSLKNQKVNVRVGRRDKMMAKYKKPQTRGQKPRGKKKGRKS
ncbi:DEAD/DEAH box helicase [Neolewinella lacunae]|uniref:DEAD/DEAH box helicase n=1 Tax=Neolewinella lacunae TaxID=1517758 RepID=A0A923T7F2_9BACT|nr:DEAD/DEAH box helicase [Neolewinella lacunae]MBC6992803.1 DEAD/DEAH box helicase [Neolewinella lacunae]MDN3636108.1 DEAD/DEAH box helicase [Neolewinella lacunae]